MSPTTNTTANTTHVFTDFETNFLNDKIKDIATNPPNYPYKDFEILNIMLTNLKAPGRMFDILLSMQFFFKIQNYDEYMTAFDLFMQCLAIEVRKGPDDYKEKYKVVFTVLMYIKSLFPQNNN